MGEKRAFDGSSKRVENGRKRGKVPSNAYNFQLKTGSMTVKINGENLPRRLEMKVAKKNRGGKN